MSEPSDEQLLNAYFGGDAKAFLTFYRRHVGRVLGYGRTKGLSDELASEACQEAFLKLHRSIHTYEKGRPALPWFFTIVHHCVMDTMRKRHQVRVLESHLAAHPQPAYVAATGTIGDDRTDAALSRLSPEQKSIVHMRISEDLSFHDISQVTGKSEATLRKIFERAKTKLRSLLGEDDAYGQ